MAASGRANTTSPLSIKPKSRTATNERCGFEDLREMKEGVLEFGIGAPSFKMLSKLRPLLAEATRQCMESGDDGYMFSYGAIRGDCVFVQALGKFLSERYQEPVNSDDLVCTAGATNGLLLLASTLFKQSDYVFLEDPTYFLALKVFHDDLGMNIVPVPTDSDGVNVEALEQLILQHQDKLGKTSEKRLYRALFYTIPVFNNPTSTSLSSERCTALIKVLRKYDLLAVCDDVYNLINFESTPPPKRLFSYDTKSDSDYKGHVVSNGSFSKIVGPGLRLGWLEAPEIVVGRVIFSAIASSGGGVNQYTSAIIGTALRNGVLSQYMTEALNTFKRNMEVMCDALDKYAKPFIKYQRPKGGYFVWVELPPDCDAKAFQEYCIKNYNVSPRAGSGCSPTGSFKNFLRLSFAFVEEEVIDNGIKDMATALQNFLKQ